MVRNFVCWICLLCLPAFVFSQESDYLLQIQAFYLMPGSQQYQLAVNYYGNFDKEPSALVLNGLPLSSAPQRIRLQFSLYSRRGLFTPDEVTFNGQAAPDPRNLVYMINNPSARPGQEPLKLSLFSNRPALDHWIDIPMIWDGQSPSPVTTATPEPSTNLTIKGSSTITVGPGHAIQVATSNKPPGIGELKEFQQFGKAYYVHEPPFYKIRIGVFPNKQDAISELVDVRHYKNGAYADAFYLYEDKARSVVQPTEEITQRPKDYDTGASVGVKGLMDSSASTSTTPVPQSYDTFGPALNRTNYENPGISIQLSVHATPPNLAEYTYLKDLAQVYVLKENNVYKLKIGPFASREAAEAAMPQIQAAGFTTAFIQKP